MTPNVFLIPAAGDPHGLLKDGACGARVPMAWRNTRTHEMLLDESFRKLPVPSVTWHVGSGGYGSLVKANVVLVLAWEGVAVLEGCDRAARVLAALDGASEPWFWKQPWTAVSYSGPWRIGTQNDNIIYAPGISEEVPTWHPVAGLSDIDPDAPFPLALATICAARGLGSLVTPAALTPTPEHK